jgi:hypothetical protein
VPPDHGHDHDHKPKPKGPKERELAVALTVAVLNASKIDGPLPAIEQMTLDVYDRMLAAVTKPAPSERNDCRE